MTKPADRFLDAGPALFGGYRIALMTGMRCDGQALFDTAADVAACAALMQLPILTTDVAIIAACRALGVATAVPPPSGKRRWRCKSKVKGKRQKAKASILAFLPFTFYLSPFTFATEEHMIEARSHLIRDRGRTRVLRLSYDARDAWFLSYAVRHRAAMCARCGCTQKRGCFGGCSWATPARDLCSRCAGRMVVR